MKRKIPKWLKYVYERFPNDEFLFQLNEQVPLLFENMVGRKIDWQKAWLFVEPIEEKYIFHYSLNAPPYKELVLMKCSLGSVEGSIGWYNDSGMETISIHDEISNRHLKFKIIDFEFKSHLFNTIPGIKKRQKHVLMNIGEIKVLFESIYHEGYLAFHFSEKPTAKIIDFIGKLLEEGRNEWNSSGNNGYFHNIYFHEMDSNKIALYYYDNGSAGNGQFKFILNKISDVPVKIEKIELIGL